MERRSMLYWYYAGGSAVAGRESVQRLNLTDDEKAQLVVFLRTLTGSNVYTDPK